MYNIYVVLNSYLSVFVYFVETNFQRYFQCICILIAMILTGLIISDFNCLVALIGGSTMVVAAFILPLVLYLKICARSNENYIWPDRYYLKMLNSSWYAVIVPVRNKSKCFKYFK